MNLNAQTTAEEVMAGVDLAGKNVVVTGSSSGIGLETARVMAAAGAKVIMANRDSDKSQAAFEQLKADLPSADIHFLKLDLGSLESIREFAEAYKASFDKLHLLINNAGVMACPQSETQDGFEMQFGTNHLGHFLLTCLLVPILSDSAPARVINLSSAGHRRASVDISDPNFQNRPYDKWESYGQSKTANILFSLELNRRLADRGVLSFSVHPGMIMTDLSRHLTQADIEEIMERASSASAESKSDEEKKPRFKSTGAGAATSVWAAVAAELESHGGSYLEDCGLSRPNEGEGDMGGYAPYAKDGELAQKLWELSEESVSQKFNF